MKKALLIILCSGFVYSSTFAQSLEKIDTIKLKEVLVSGVRESVEKSGYRFDTTSMAYLGNIGLIDIPLSVNVTSGKLIDTRDTHNLIDALKTNSSVIPVLNPNNDERGLANTIIRGFSPNYLLDGLTINSYHIPPVENVERIETLNGLNSFFYGFSSFGGAINFVSKRPLKETMMSISSGIHNGSVNYAGIDAGGPINKGKQLTYRFNGYKEGGETYIKGQKQENSFFTYAMNYNLKRTNFRVDLYHQDYQIEGQQNVFTVNPSKNIILPTLSLFDPRKLYGQPWTFSILHFNQIGGSLESKLSDNLSLRTAYRYGEASWKYNYVLSAMNDNDGNFTETDKDFGTQQRYYNAGYALFDYTIHTYGIEHNITFGYSGSNTLIHFGGNPNLSKVLGKYNLSTPVYVTMPDTIPSFSNDYTNYNRYYYHTILVSDRMVIGKYFSAIIGLSKAIYKTIRTTGNLSQSGSADYTQNKIMPSASLVYKPMEKLSVYTSYMQGLGIGGTAPDIAKNAGEILKPSVNQQYEAGVKTSIKTMNLSLSFFKIDVINEYLDPSDSIYKQDGKELHQGLEFNVSGKAFKNLIVCGGITVMDVRVLRAKNNTAIEGKTPQNIPENYANIYIEYQIPHIERLSISVGSTYCDRRPVDAINSLYIPGYTSFDGGIHFQTDFHKTKLIFNINISNILDTKYYASYTSTGLRLGVPRLISVSVKLKL